MRNKDKAPYSIEQIEEVGKAMYEIGKLALEKAGNDPEKAQYLLELTAYIHQQIMDDGDYGGLENYKQK